MKKRMTIMLIALAIVFGGIIGFNLIKSIMMKRFFANFQAPAVSVSTVKATEINWEPHISAVGNFLAVNGVDVNSQASGNVVKIHFDSGQFIEKDQPLIDIEDSIDQANLKFNQADKALKEISYTRQTDLFKRGATSSSSLDEAKANLQQAQANVEKIEAQIKQKHIAAPFSGQLGIRQVNLGQYISPGQTSIVTLQSLDPLYLEFNLPEQMYKLLHINQAIQFHVEGFNDVVFEGKISAINSKVDPASHNILVQATLPNCPVDALKTPSKEKNGNIIRCDSNANSQNKVHEFLFLPGMFAKIAVEQKAIPGVVVLPSTAISYSLYGNTVFVVQKNGIKDDHGNEALYVKRVFIKTGEQDGNFTVILSGIKPGDVVVSSGEIKLQNEARVVINNSVKLDETVPRTLGQ